MPEAGRTIRLAIHGSSGRMGGAIARLAARAPDLEVAGGIARSGGTVDVDAAGPLIEACDVVIDVSAPDALARLLDLHGARLAGRALVVGTTGMDADLIARVEGLGERAAVLVASNFSMGVNLLLGLVRRAAAALPAADWDIEIVETHHRAKADAPSGTALSLGDAVDQGRGSRSARTHGRHGRTGARTPGEVGFHALRGGGTVGEHRVLFLGARERIEIAHAAGDRDVFAEGALTAARWIAGRAPGIHDMDDVLDG